jgi:CBS domain-containing protein
VLAVGLDTPGAALRSALHGGPDRRPQRLYPVVDANGRLAGVVTRRELQEIVDDGVASVGALFSGSRKAPTVAYPDESLRVVVYRMAGSGLTRFPVVDRESGRLVGMIALADLLGARTRNLEAEQRRERVFALPSLFASVR